MAKFLIIADDFTGANDTGVQFTKRGLATEVIFGGEIREYKSQALVIDTESRGLEGEDAYRRVKDLSEGVLKSSFQCVYKKVDSTLRGNVSEEVRAIDELYKPELIVFAPAFPSSGRTTIGGVQHMKGVPVSQTEIGKDPKKPVTEDNIASILRAGLAEEVTHVSIEQLGSNNMDFSNGRIFTFDALENKDLIKIVEQVQKQNKRTLWIGSAGLADAIMQVTVPMKPVLSIVGSISQVSSSQISFAEEKGVKIIKVDISKLLEGHDESYALKEAVSFLSSGQDVVVTSSYTREMYEETIETGRELGMSKEQISIFTQETLGKLTADILKEVQVAGLLLTGGDTAIEVIRKVNASSSLIMQELAVGIPMMRLQGGNCNGLPVVTKAGAFGETNALHYCIQKIKELSK